MCARLSLYSNWVYGLAVSRFVTCLKLDLIEMLRFWGFNAVYMNFIVRALSGKKVLYVEIVVSLWTVLFDTQSLIKVNQK